MTIAKFYLEDLRAKFWKIDPKEYYLSYSGGKDSHLLYWFIKEYAPEFKDIKVVGINTYMEHPQIRKRIYDNCDIVLLPTMKPFDIKKEYGIPCFSKTQDYLIDLVQRGTIGEKARERLITGYFVGKDGELVKDKFGLNKKAKELLLKGELHRISPKCCEYLKKKPAKEFDKKTGLKPIMRSKR